MSGSEDTNIFQFSPRTVEMSISDLRLNLTAF